MEQDERFMKDALREACTAASEDEVPIGAVITCRGRIIAKGHNMTERLNDPTAHAEMIAITAATEAMGGKYLNDCTIYVPGPWHGLRSEGWYMELLTPKEASACSLRL